VQLSKALERLHSVRKIEEQQQEAELNEVTAELYRLRGMLDRVHQRIETARALASASIGNGMIEDRFSALEETVLLGRLATVLVKKVKLADQRLLEARAQLLAKRIERRQVETLLDAAQRQVEKDENRKSQQSLDEWYRLRRV
jgi:flagellar export protein FliJ